MNKKTEKRQIAIVFFSFFSGVGDNFAFSPVILLFDF